MPTPLTVSEPFNTHPPWPDGPRHLYRPMAINLAWHNTGSLENITVINIDNEVPAELAA